VIVRVPPVPAPHPVSGVVVRSLLLCACAAALAALFYVVLWPLGYQLSDGPYFTYQFLVSSHVTWDRLYRLFGWLPWLSPWARPPADLLGGLWLVFYAAVFAVYLCAYAVLRWAQRVGSRTERLFLLGVTLACTLLFQVVLFSMPGVFTTDMFSYVTYGFIAGSFGGNPFVEYPALYPWLTVANWVPAIWQFAPSVYGPLWIDLSMAVERLSVGRSAVEQVQAYRLVANFAHLANVGLFALIVRHFTPRAVLPATLLFAWNPLLLFEFAGSGHNDALMLTAALLAVYLFTRERIAAGIVALAASAMIKYVTVLALPVFLAYWAWQQPTPLRRLAVFCAGGTLALLVMAVLYLPWYQGPDTFRPLLSWTSQPHYANSPNDWLAGDLARLMDPSSVRRAQALAEAHAVLQLLGLAMLALVVAVEAWYARTLRGAAAGSARVMLVFLLAYNPWVLPWYFTWPLAFGLLAGWETRTARVCLLFSLTAPAVMHFTAIWGGAPANLFNVLYLAPLLLPLLPRLIAAEPVRIPIPIPIPVFTASGAPEAAAGRVSEGGGLLPGSLRSR
jgi:hypothetical protein